MWLQFALVVVVVVVAIAGCGPSAYQKTLSVLNTEADRWEGGKEFTTSAVDAYGQPLMTKVEKGPLNYTLEVRSAGPDKLPKNSDDIFVTRIKRHGESSIAQEAAKVTEAVASGAASGTIKGLKQGLKDE